MHSGTRSRLSAFSVAAILALAFDQLSKMWARNTLRPIYPDVKTVIRGVWEFRYSENPGAAFGLFRDWPIMQWLFAAVGLAVVVGAVMYLLRAELKHPVRAAAEMGLIAGGAIGNMIDRLVFHRVTDFVVWKWHGHEWDTFNVADAALVVGIILLILDGGGVKKKAAAQS
jgi:signal peptidase II